MTYNIKVQPSGVCFQSEQIILDDALVNNIHLEHSCKSGDCGACTAEVLSGEVENENGEVVTEGIILTCRSKAKTDVVIKANYYPELANQKMQTLPAKVDSIEFVTEDVAVVKLRLPPTAKLDYLPGQYIDLISGSVKRSYSIANAQCASSGIELHIRHVPNGKMSSLVFSELKPNQLLRLEGPKGTFFARQSDKPMILLAGGTGISPIKAILEQHLVNKTKRELRIYWGMNSKVGFYLPELFELSKRHPNVHFTPVLSGEEHWQGRMGYVHEAVCEDFETLKQFQVYACGSPLMINVAKAAFLEKSLPENQFYSDAFTPAK